MAQVISKVVSLYQGRFRKRSEGSGCDLFSLMSSPAPPTVHQHDAAHVRSRVKRGSKKKRKYFVTTNIHQQAHDLESSGLANDSTVAEQKSLLAFPTTRTSFLFAFLFHRRRWKWWWRYCTRIGALSFARSALHHLRPCVVQLELPIRHLA